jgi:hypothetical protein
MFETTSKFAGKLATAVSRRMFLGSLGRWTGATALGLAGVLTWPSSARAGGPYTCCEYGYMSARCYVCIKGPQRCPIHHSDCGAWFLYSSYRVKDCTACPGTGGGNQ